MNKKEAQELFDRYTANLCTPEERAIVERWYAQESGLQQLAEVNDLEKAKNEMWGGVLRRTGLTAPNRKTSPLVWMSSAAALFILVGAALYLYISRPVQPHLAAGQVVADVLPGRDNAVLTLADGSTILLGNAKNGRLASEGHTVVNKTANGQLKYNVLNMAKASSEKVAYNRVSTPKGGQYHVILPDGTGVWLNSVSSVKFPVAFTDKERNVEITGEAYFEVAANKSRPFNVKAGKANVRVLGTHFNVMAYQDEASVNVTLLEGSVKVSTGSAVNMLKPGQQAQALNGKIAVLPADTEEAIAWKKGYFYFKDADIKTVMRQISRWYDVGVEYNGTGSEVVFSGKMYRNVDIMKMLEVLTYFNVDYKVMDTKRHKGKKTIVIN